MGGDGISTMLAGAEVVPLVAVAQKQSVKRSQGELKKARAQEERVASALRRHAYRYRSAETLCDATAFILQWAFPASQNSGHTPKGTLQPSSC